MSKKIVILDPEASFERTSRHLHRCKTCRYAGMEWARAQDLCKRGRELVEELERVERIYAVTERAA